MEDTIRASLINEKDETKKSLNPCFNGRYYQSLPVTGSMHQVDES